LTRQRVGAENSVTITDVRIPPKPAPHVRADLNAFKNVLLTR
jgi:hypothetical protein